MQGKHGNMATKIDPEKTFGRIEWSYIKETLQFFGFPANLTNLILYCISSSSI